MSFIVIPNDVTVFRVKISNLSCDVINVNPNFSNFTIDGIFDLFRTFKTPATNNSPSQPTWEDFEVMFLYETAMPELLVAKNCMIALSCKDASMSEGTSTNFIGQAVIDLLTLAAGPSDITLQLLSGDVVTGRLYAKIEMQEISEMQVEMKDWRIYEATGKSLELESLIVTVYKRQNEDEVLTATTKLETDEDGKKYLALTIPPHLFAITFPDMSETGGFRVELAKKALFSKDLIAVSNILFASHTMNKRDGDDRYGDFTFSSNFESGVDTIGVLKGQCVLSHIPIYSQMYSGRTVDGVVCFGKPYNSATKLPPFISTEHRAADVMV